MIPQVVFTYVIVSMALLVVTLLITSINIEETKDPVVRSFCIIALIALTIGLSLGTYVCWTFKAITEVTKPAEK